jgi:lysozyme
MNISEKGVEAIKKFEGCKTKAYQCSAGHWTIGVGHVGPEVNAGTVWEMDRVNATFCRDIMSFELSVRKLVNVKIDQAKYDALVSFCFNLGAANLKSSTLLRKLNSGDIEGAAAEFPKWDNVRVAGKLQPDAGLRRRRLAEQAMFLNAKYPEVW